jgi:hypothetical protein
LTTGFVFAIIKPQSEVDMRFYTLAERKPIEGQRVLAKIDRCACCGNYYVLEYEAGWGWEVDEGKPFHIM